MTIAEQPHKRPRTRGECPPVDPDLGWRLCPFAGCRHHLYLEVYGATVVTLDGDLAELATQRPLCALDVADIGAPGVDESRDEMDNSTAIGRLLGISRQRVRHIEQAALGKIRRDARLMEYAGEKQKPLTPVIFEDGQEVVACYEQHGLSRATLAKLTGLCATQIDAVGSSGPSDDWSAPAWHSAIAITEAIGHHAIGAGPDYDMAVRYWQAGSQRPPLHWRSDPDNTSARDDGKARGRPCGADLYCADPARLDAAIAASGVARRRLHIAAGVSATTIKRARRGGNVGASHWRRIADALGVDPCDLIEGGINEPS